MDGLDGSGKGRRSSLLTNLGLTHEVVRFLVCHIGTQLSSTDPNTKMYMRSYSMDTQRGNNYFPRHNTRRILFQGTPSVKTVNHYSHLSVDAVVTPLVVIQDGKDAWEDDELHWGLVLQCVPQSVLEDAREEEEDVESALEPFEIDTTFSAWSNPVRWWRALQLLEAMPVLDHRNLELDLWIATGRPDPDDTFDHSLIQELRDTFAEGFTYEEIMARPVPLEITQLTLQLLDEGLEMHHVRYDLTDEIEAGTIRWSQELKRRGVIHPDYRKAVQAARDVVVERYKDHLFSYAAFRECSYENDSKQKAFIIVGIERCIYNAIERGIERDYGMDITALVSILHEEITCDDILEHLEKKHPRDREGYEPYRRTTPEERFSRVIAWMTERCSKDGTVLLLAELDETLHQLFEQWETRPISQPLVS